MTSVPKMSELSQAQLVTVEVKDGVVTLSGPVESKPQKDKAEHIAKKVKGVKKVVNNIEIKSR